MWWYIVDINIIIVHSVISYSIRWTALRCIWWYIVEKNLTTVHIATSQSPRLADWTIILLFIVKRILTKVHNVISQSPWLLWWTLLNKNLLCVPNLAVIHLGWLPEQTYIKAPHLALITIKKILSIYLLKYILPFFNKISTQYVAWNGI